MLSSKRVVDRVYRRRTDIARVAREADDRKQHSKVAVNARGSVEFPSEKVQVVCPWGLTAAALNPEGL